MWVTLGAALAFFALVLGALHDSARVANAQSVECPGRLPCLVIEKFSLGESDTFSFTLSGATNTQVSIVTDILLDEDFYGGFAVIELNVGTTFVTEEHLSGWQLYAMECEANPQTLVQASSSNNRGEITLPSNQPPIIVAACFFGNTRPERAPRTGAFPALGNAAKKNQTAAAGAAQVGTPAATVGTLKPPSTGDAGLFDDRMSNLTFVVVLVGALAAGYRITARARRRS
ncbi:MAG TPA: hypothetical protein VI759_07705 [Dehalococcoidia bacterium]|nr:hypothetical protein [Dehalococcoidia bacterium]